VGIDNALVGPTRDACHSEEAEEGNARSSKNIILIFLDPDPNTFPNEYTSENKGSKSFRMGNFQKISLGGITSVTNA
jgi:hypothetical protein